MGKPFRIEYSAEARDHLRALDGRARATILDRVERKLRFEPTIAARNRKLLQSNELAPWELRVQRWRVYYEVRQDAVGHLVLVKAIGVKQRGKVLIAGEEIEL